MKWRSMRSVTSKSAITPWRRGRIAEIVAGVRPIIRRAASPTEWTVPVSLSTAATDGPSAGAPLQLPRPRQQVAAAVQPQALSRERRRLDNRASQQVAVRFFGFWTRTRKLLNELPGGADVVLGGLTYPLSTTRKAPRMNGWTRQK